MINHFNRITAILTLIIIVTVRVSAQNYIFTIGNEVQVSDRSLTFDLYLLNTNISRPFELSGVQAGILVNPAIYNNGAITVTIVGGTSQLNTSMTPTNVIWSAGENTIKLTPKAPPGAGGGTILSTSAPGTRVCRLQITNTAPFARARANLAFSFTTVPYPTKVAEYILGVNTQLISDASNCYSNADDIILNDINPGQIPVTVAASPSQSKVYGDPDPAFTYTFTPPLNGNDVFTGSLSRTAGENAGSYTIQQGTLSAGPGYTITFIPASFNISKAPLQVTADTKQRNYLESNPALTISYSGFKSGENASVLDVPPATSTTAIQNSDAGTYDILVSGGSDNNYSFNYIKGILTILKINQEISFDQIPDGLRISDEHQLVATATSGLPVTFESSDANKASITGNTLRINGEGSVTIKAMQGGNINWNPAPDAIQTLVVSPSFDNINSLFTPNADGVNDYWQLPLMDQYGDTQVKVYNRFGMLVYESAAYKNDWDGTFNGNPLPSASYYYILKTSNMGIIKGVVNIVR